MSQKRKPRPGVARQGPGERGDPAPKPAATQSKPATSEPAAQESLQNKPSAQLDFWSKQEAVWAGVLFLLYATVASWGQFDFSDMMGYYNLLADAFQQGQLHIAIRPDQVYLHDMIPYQGRYYLQWGPFPAVVHLTTKLVGLSLSDRVACLLIGWLTSLVFLRIIVLLGRHFLPSLPRGVYLWFFFAFALATPNALIALRGTVYHESIGTAGLGVMGAFLAFLLYLLRPSWSYASACGLGIAIAVASRVPLAIYGIGLGCSLLVVHYVRRYPLSNVIGHVAAYSVPILISGALLATYNYNRFGSPWEYGEQYLPSGRAGVAPFHVKRIPENVKHYLLTPIQFTADFPWLLHESSTPLVETKRAEDVSSLLLTSPFLLLALFSGSLLRGSRPFELKCFVAATLLSSTLSFFAMLCFISAARRYAHDFVPLWMILAFVGLAAHSQRAMEWRRWRHAAWTGLVFSALLHMHLSFTQMFSWEPPDLNVIKTFLSVSPKARQFLPAGPVWDEQEARIRNDLGAYFLNQGRAAEALPHFERAAELMPNDERIRRNVALARERAAGKTSADEP